MSIPSELPDDVQQRLNNELRPGERVAWAAQPSGAIASKASCFIYVFAIPWTLFSVFWVIFAAQASLLFALFGVPFVLVGLGMFRIPAWIKKMASRSVYAVTDQRAITIKAGLFGSFTVKSYLPEQLLNLERTEYKDGSGDLIFHKYYTRDSDGDRHLNREGFEGIPQVKQVEALIQAMVATHQVAKREVDEA
jgi:hypothetical protein